MFSRSRAVCPANEGIETLRRQAAVVRPGVARSAPLMRGLKREPWLESGFMFSRSRAVCPANEGIETLRRQAAVVRPGALAARSAPLMRGLKLITRLNSAFINSTGRAVCPANEGIETSPAKPS